MELSTGPRIIRLPNEAPSVNTAAMEMISIVKLTLRFDFLLTNEILEAASTLPRLNTLEIQNVRLVEIHQ